MAVLGTGMGEVVWVPLEPSSPWSVLAWKAHDLPILDIFRAAASRSVGDEAGVGHRGEEERGPIAAMEERGPIAAMEGILTACGDGTVTGFRVRVQSLRVTNDERLGSESWYCAHVHADALRRRCEPCCCGHRSSGGRGPAWEMGCCQGRCMPRSAHSSPELELRAWQCPLP